MLAIIRTPTHQIAAAIDYYLVNDEGQIVFDGQGSHIWVEQIEVSAGVDGRACIAEFIQRITQAIPQAVDGYWYRKVRSDTHVYRFSRQRLLRRAHQLQEVAYG